MRHSFPLAYPGMRIGLFGGSFDPAHEGHAHVAETARKRLKLDRVWWLVTPQNPLKPQASPLAHRVASARALAHGRAMVVTDLEARLGCRYTFETLRVLKQRYRGVRFILLLGADNLRNFHRWKNWREVAAAGPIAVVARPGFGPRERLSMSRDWVFLNARHHDQSSTAVRARQVAKPKRK